MDIVADSDTAQNNGVIISNALGVGYAFSDITGSPITLPTGNLWVSDDVRVGGGLYVGAVDVDPAPGNLIIEAASNPQIRCTLAASPTSFFRAYNTSATQSVVQHWSDAGAADLLLEAVPNDGSSAASIRLFRLTNTSGGALFQVLLGTNSTTANCQLGGTGDTKLASNNGDLYLSRTGGKTGFMGATPVVRAAHIADATDLSTALTRIAAINVVLENLGFVATS
jgi:hypothetical protein